MGLFKKGKPQKSESGNHAWDSIEGAMSPALGYVGQGGDAIANLLGVGSGGAGAQTGALENFANSGGMEFLREQGNKQITSNKAAAGLMKSGSFGTALEKYGQGLGSTYLNQYMDNLFKLSNVGLGAGGLMANAGQYGTGTGATAPGAGKQMASQLASAGITAGIGALSDERLKENIVRLENGLVEFNYKQDTVLNLPKGRFVGYLAHEVPHYALGPTVKGYKTVLAPYLPKRIN